MMEAQVYSETPVTVLKSFFDPKERVEELLLQYQKHNTLIIAVDFDDTIYDLYKAGKDFTPIYDILKRAKAVGCSIMIFTARNKASFYEITEHCNDIGLEYDKINEDVITLDYGYSRKPYYNVFLDDKAGLLEAYTILKAAIEVIEKQVKEKNKSKIEETMGVNSNLVTEMVKSNTLEYNILKFLEEGAECNEIALKFLTKAEKYRPLPEKFHEELSHLELRLAVMKEIFGPKEVEAQLNKKQNSIAARIEQKKQNNL